MVDFKKSKFNNNYSGQSVMQMKRIASDYLSRKWSNSRETALYAAEMTQGHCLFCGKKMFREVDGVPVFNNDVAHDHLYPAANFNLYVPGNGAITCNDCNSEKSDKDPIEYHRERSRAGRPLFIEDDYLFKAFVHRHTEPYRTGEFAEYYKAGTGNTDETDTEIMKRLFFPYLEIESMKQAYVGSVNHDNLWAHILSDDNPYYVQKKWADHTINDVKSRIGHANEVFEELFGTETLIEDLTVTQMKTYGETLVRSRAYSRSEVEKIRRLFRTVLATINLEALFGIDKELPKTADVLREHKENEGL